jgi:hypothetical protein
VPTTVARVTLVDTATREARTFDWDAPGDMRVVEWCWSEGGWSGDDYRAPYFGADDADRPGERLRYLVLAVEGPDAGADFPVWQYNQGYPDALLREWLPPHEIALMEADRARVASYGQQVCT